MNIITEQHNGYIVNIIISNAGEYVGIKSIELE